jgi:hypothetical protein
MHPTFQGPSLVVTGVLLRLCEPPFMSLVRLETSQHGLAYDYTKCKMGMG